MDMIFEDDVATTPPAEPTTPAAGYPSDGDLTTGKPATVIGAYWFYMITKELLNLIGSAGIAADASTLTQVAAAVQTIASNLATAARDAAIATATTLATTAHDTALSTVLGWFTGTNASYTPNGYQVLPGGGIRNWCQQAVTGLADGEVTFTYAKPFTSFSAVPVPSVVDPGRSGDESNFLGISVISYSLTGCVVAYGQNGGGARNVTAAVVVDGK